jgi:hypothetical protein
MPVNDDASIIFEFKFRVDDVLKKILIKLLPSGSARIQDSALLSNVTPAYPA